MKKCFFFGLTVFSCIGISHAQLSKGGFPQSLKMTNTGKVPVYTYPLPDWNAFQEKVAAGEDGYDPQLDYIALLADVDIKFPESGTFMKGADGSLVWKAQLQIDGSPGTGFIYDKFFLPKGVKYYISNATGSHVLGAYTASNNNAEHTFANEAVQGGTVNVELNIASGVDLNAIDFHIEKAAVYFAGVQYLKKYISEDRLRLISHYDSAAGSSSVCTINAICPLGQDYKVQKRATVQVIFVSGGSSFSTCSGTMVNRVGNTPEDCKQYFLAASHCKSTGTSNSVFSNTLFRFNFEAPVCDRNDVVAANTLTGADFVARSVFTSADPQQIKGDFLMLELREKIPDNWYVTFAGWDRQPDHDSTAIAPKKFIGFHHPNGDIKKVSSSQTIMSALRGDTIPSHWRTELDSGVVASGSSGSGFFDGDGRLIGVGSVAGPLGLPSRCFKNAAGETARGTGNLVYYAKFSYSWDYMVDGTSERRRLWPWLDPQNTGVVTLDPIGSDCKAIVPQPEPVLGIKDNEVLDQSISIYPNPSYTGDVTARFNFTKPVDLTAEVYNIAGARIQYSKLSKVQQGLYTFDLSSFSNGIYLIKFSSEKGSSMKKIVLNR